MSALQVPTSPHFPLQFNSKPGQGGQMKPALVHRAFNLLAGGVHPRRLEIRPYGASRSKSIDTCRISSEVCRGAGWASCRCMEISWFKIFQVIQTKLIRALFSQRQLSNLTKSRPTLRATSYCTERHLGINHPHVSHVSPTDTLTRPTGLRKL